MVMSIWEFRIEWTVCIPSSSSLQSLSLELYSHVFCLRSNNERQLEKLLMSSVVTQWRKSQNGTRRKTKSANFRYIVLNCTNNRLCFKLYIHYASDIRRFDCVVRFAYFGLFLSLGSYKPNDTACDSYISKVKPMMNVVKEGRGC